MHTNPTWAAENQKLADEFAKPGTNKYYLLQLGFMPHDEDEANTLIKGVLDDIDEGDGNFGLSDSEIDELRRRRG